MSAASMCSTASAAVSAASVALFFDVAFAATSSLLWIDAVSVAVSGGRDTVPWPVITAVVPSLDGDEPVACAKDGGGQHGEKRG